MLIVQNTLKVEPFIQSDEINKNSSIMTKNEMINFILNNKLFDDNNIIILVDFLKKNSNYIKEYKSEDRYDLSIKSNLYCGEILRIVGKIFISFKIDSFTYTQSAYSKNQIMQNISIEDNNDVDISKLFEKKYNLVGHVKKFTKTTIFEKNIPQSVICSIYNKTNRLIDEINDIDFNNLIVRCYPSVINDINQYPHVYLYATKKKQKTIPCSKSYAISYNLVKYSNDMYYMRMSNNNVMCTMMIKKSNIYNVIHNCDINSVLYNPNVEQCYYIESYSDRKKYIKRISHNGKLYFFGELEYYYNSNNNLLHSSLTRHYIMHEPTVAKYNNMHHTQMYISKLHEIKDKIFLPEYNEKYLNQFIMNDIIESKFTDVIETDNDIMTTTTYYSNNKMAKNIYVIMKDQNIPNKHIKQYYKNNKLYLEILKTHSCVNDNKKNQILNITDIKDLYTVNYNISYNDNVIHQNIIDNKTNKCIFDGIMKNGIPTINLNLLGNKYNSIASYAFDEFDKIFNVNNMQMYEFEYEKIKTNNYTYQFDYKREIDIIINNSSLFKWLKNIYIKCFKNNSKSELEMIEIDSYQYENGKIMENKHIDKNNNLDIKELDIKPYASYYNGWKLAKTEDNVLCMVQLQIPKTAKVVLDHRYQKYRCNIATVVSITALCELYDNGKYMYYAYGDIKGDATCGICMDKNANHMAFPCRHRLCGDCWKVMMAKNVLICPYCRANVKSVHLIHEIKNKENTNLNCAYSCIYSTNFKYEVGKEVVVHNFCSNLNKNCGPGIHYTDSPQKALEWVEYSGTYDLFN